MGFAVYCGPVRQQAVPWFGSQAIKRYEGSERDKIRIGRVEFGGGPFLSPVARASMEFSESSTSMILWLREILAS
jgi:hypothetical protein